jgi:tripartite motif-containing protein 2/3
MADSRPVSNRADVFDCSICIGVFNNPKFLPCFHSFCETCLSGYLTKTVQPLATDFLCPVCRTETPSPKPDSPVGEWSLHFPTNHQIVSLIDSLKQTDRHMQQIQQQKTSTDTANDNTCPDHPTKMLEVLCVDHNTACCVTCLTETHRKCDKVVSLEKLASTFRGRHEDTACLQRLLTCASKTSNLANNRLANIQTLDESKKTILANIKQCRKDVNTFFDKLEASLTDKI